ncbi:MAG: alanine racemase, partial [Clostridiales bacterium]|nr:alanine racemase [Clostridiales bacterium]MDY4111802.1 alanine racemase [Roseburia sp.]
MKRYSRVHAEIDLDAITHNMNAMHANISENTKIMAVIKADGYGHGAVEIAEAIDDLPYVFGYAVATVEEGLILRNHGIEKPILILGYVFPEQYHDMIRARIRPTVFTSDMAERLSFMAGRLDVDCPIHFAIDTGMSRIGYQVTEEAADEMARIASLPHIVVEGIFTHFAKADEADKTSTYKQLQLFEHMVDMLEERGVSIPIHHCSNSAAIVEVPEANMDLVRAGITMYGLWPSPEVDKNRIDLKPALSLVTHVAYVKELEAGREISYGGTYTTTKKQMIATIPVGYADGYARTLSNKGDVLIHGQRAPICGRVCMDQFM